MITKYLNSYSPKVELIARSEISFEGKKLRADKIIIADSKI